MDKDLVIRVLLAGSDQLSKPLRSTAELSRAAAKEMREARERVRELNREQLKIDRFRDLKKAASEARERFESARKEATAWGEQMSRVEKPTKAQAEAMAKAKQRASELETAWHNQQRRLNEMRSEMAKAGMSTTDLAGHQVRVREQLDRASNAMKEQAERSKQLAMEHRRLQEARQRVADAEERASTIRGHAVGALAGAAVVAAPMAYGVREAIQFESAMADVRKVVDFPTPEGLIETERRLTDMSTQLPFAREELAQIYAAGGAAGLPQDELLGFTETAGKMGIAFGMAASEAGRYMAQWRKAFQMTQSEVVVLSDQINYLGNTSGAQAPAISEVVSRVGPIAGVAGAAASEVAAVSATMLAMGVNSEVAATGTKNLMLRLTRGAAATREQQAAFAELGMTSTQVTRDMQNDAEGTLMAVINAIKRLPEAQRSGVITRLFGEESVAPIATLITATDQLEQNFARVNDETLYGGSMLAEFGAQAGTAANRLKMLQNSNDAMAGQIGANLLPTLLAASEVVKDMSDGFRRFSDEHPNTARAVTVIVAGITALVAIAAVLGIAVSGLLVPIAILRGRLLTTAAASTANAAASTAAAGGFKAAAASAWAYTGALGKKALGAMAAFGRGTLALGASLWRTAVPALATAATSVWGFTAALLANPITWIIIGIVAAVALLAGGIYLLMRNWDKIGPWLGNLWNTVTEKFNAGLNFLRGARDLFMAAGRHLLDGLIQGVRDKLDAVKDTITEAGRKVASWFKDVLGIRSPSRVFAAIGDDTMAGLALGLQRSGQEPINRIRAIAGRMAGAAAGVTASAAVGLGTVLASPAAAGAAVVNNTYQISVTVQAQPGQSAEQLGQAIAAAVAQAVQGAAPNDGGAGFDDPVD